MKKFFILSFAALICACTGQQGGNIGDGLAELSWGADTLSIENPIVPGEELCYKIDITLDTLAGEGELAKSLAAVLRDSVLHKPGRATVHETMAAFADSIETEWKTELAERYEFDSEYKDILQYYYTIEGSPVESRSDSILSYQTVTDCFLGGAHGIYAIQYYNFDRRTGKLLNIQDIVPAEKEMLVLKAMEEQLCEDWDASDLADLQEMTGITMLGDLYLTNNFLLKGDSIEFLFNVYEIAPYAAGLISVTLPRP